MFGFEDISKGIGGDLPVLILAVLLAVTLLILIIVTARYKMQQYYMYRRDLMEHEVAGRRRIRVADKRAVFERDNYTCQICGISKGLLDSYCEGLGDYLLLEADHIRSVSQGGTGKKGGYKTNAQVRAMIDYGVEFTDMDQPYIDY